jgi:hypothetical protein
MQVEVLKQEVLSPSRRLFVFVIVAAILALSGSFLAYQYHSRVGHDQLSYLFEAQRFLDGNEIYGPNLVETNPPVIIWFSVIPVVFAHVFQLAPDLVFRAFVAALLLLTTVWCSCILYRTRASRLTDVLSLGLFAYSLVIVLFTTGGYDFGQREHLFVIFVLPYLLLSTTEEPSRVSQWERVLIGMCAGVSVWFKPHDILAILALEVFRAVQTRSFRRVISPEVISFVVTCVAILVLVLLCTPLYRTATLPLLFDTYWAFGYETTLVLFIGTRKYLLFIGLLCVAVRMLRQRLADSTTTLGLLFAGVGASIAYDLQHTEWPYHLYPHRIFLVLACAYVTIDLLSPYFVRMTQTRRLIVLCATALILCWVSVPLNHRLRFLRGTEADFAFSALPPSTTVYAISTGVPALASAYYYHLNWGGRFAHLWMLPAIIQNETGRKPGSVPFKRLSRETVAYLGTLQRRETTEDLNHWRPEVVLVEHCTPEGLQCSGLEGKQVDLLEWFLRDPQFATVWSHYRRQPSSIPRFDVYRLVP